MKYVVYNPELDESKEYDCPDPVMAGEAYATDLYHSSGVRLDVLELDVTDEDGTIWDVTVDVETEVTFDGFAVVRKRSRG